MGAIKEKKTKAQIAAAAAAGSRSKKKKWSKGKTKEKARNAVFFDDATLAKFKTDVPKARLITPYTVSDRLKITVSLAKRAIRDLESQGLIRKCAEGNTMIYTRTGAAPAAAPTAATTSKSAKKGKKAAEEQE